MRQHNDSYATTNASPHMDDSHETRELNESSHSRPPISAPPLPIDGPHARDAKKALALEANLKEQMDLYGQGHPQSGQLAVSFATMCNDIARGCMQEGRLKLTHELLQKAIHLLKLDHSAMTFADNRKVMASVCCNMGSLMHKRHLPQEALKWITRAIHIESKADYEPSHAATYINVSTTYSLLGRHDEALQSAKNAVDMLCKKAGWHLSVEDPDDEAGDLLPMAFNNLAVEFEHVGDAEMAKQSYAYAADLAKKRWGKEDERTKDILGHQGEVAQGKELTHFDAEAAKIFYGRRKGKTRGHGLKVLGAYDESTSPVSRKQERSPGFYSPRFWSSTDGMNPRRMSPYNKDLAQISLEMVKTAGPRVLPSFTDKTSWGESRMVWRNLPETDQSRIDGSVPSRSRLFSDVATNTQLNAIASVYKNRKEISARYPRNLAVFKAARELADQRALERQETGMTLESSAFLSGTYLARPFRIH